MYCTIRIRIRITTNPVYHHNKRKGREGQQLGWRKQRLSLSIERNLEVRWKTTRKHTHAHAHTHTQDDNNNNNNNNNCNNKNLLHNNKHNNIHRHTSQHNFSISKSSSTCRLRRLPKDHEIVFVIPATTSVICFIVADLDDDNSCGFNHWTTTRKQQPTESKTIR